MHLGNSLEVQLLGFSWVQPTAKAWLQSLVGKLRSHKLRGKEGRKERKKCTQYQCLYRMKTEGHENDWVTTIFGRTREALPEKSHFS